jgi:hypothetical protein
MAITYTPIDTQTLGSAAASVTFSSISGSYTDLVLVTNASNVSTDSNLNLQFNSDTASNYSSTRLSGDGSTATSATTANLVYIVAGRANATGSIAANSIVNIMNYSNTTTYKTVLTRANNAASIVGAYVGMWRNTAAITSILIYSNNAANISAGSTFTLYGIKAA